jgi:ABC-type amino acid transport system permease subunit
MFYSLFFQAVLAGDLILSAASVALARIGNTAVVSMLAQVIEDLVRGKSVLMFLFYLEYQFWYLARQ